MISFIYINNVNSIQNVVNEYTSRGYNISSKISDNDCIKEENDGTYSNYKFHMEFEKFFTFQEKIMLSIKAFCETFFSLGLSLISQNVRDDWEKAFCDKKVVQLYMYDRPILINSSYARI